MEMLIIGTGCLLGYVLNKDGKTSRSPSNTIQISPNRAPHGPLIYESNRVSEVKSLELDLAAGKHAEKMKQTYPDTYAQPVSVYPGDDYATAGYPAPLQAIGDDGSGQAQFGSNLQQALATNKNTGAYDPSSGLALFPSTADTIDSSPMFRAFEFKGPMVNADMPALSGPISLLSGQPLDMSHHNMQPMFGSTVKQPAVDNANSQVLLERFTGMPSTDDQGTYRSKMEVLNPLPNNPDSLARANITQEASLYDRARISAGTSHEYQSPIQATRDVPMQADSIRILPYDIDQLRGPLNKQVTYESVMIPGQKGSTRGMLPNMRANPWDLSRETSTSMFNPNRAAAHGKNLTVAPSVRNVLATTQDQAVNYFSAPNHQRKLGDYSSRLDSQRATADETVSRRIEPFSPGFGTARGTGAGRNVGTLLVKDTERGTETKHTGQPVKSNGMTQRNVSAPEYTLRDATAVNTVGAGNASGLKSNTSYRAKNLIAPVTTKDLNGKNRYRGQPHKNLGMGFVKQGIQKWTTNKETNQFSQRGNPMSNVTAHMSYEAVFEDGIDKTVAGDRYGVAKGRNSHTKQTGEVNNNSGPELEVENYLGNATAPIPGGRDRDAFAAGLTENIGGDKVEFGGHMNVGKMAIGPSGARKSAMRVKEDTTVAGRINVPLRRDNPNQDGLSTQTQLKQDQGSLAPRGMVQRTQPLQVVTDRMPVVVKTKNVEALNPRLDTGTRITTDLYPWIKER